MLQNVLKILLKQTSLSDRERRLEATVLDTMAIEKPRLPPIESLIEYGGHAAVGRECFLPASVGSTFGGDTVE
jgi:hypothetical protein